MFWQEVIRLLVAAGLGSLIGLERERMERGAGLRTHALVATASALILLVSSYGFSDVITPGKVVLDPSRVAAQVVSGIGFLGAGTILLRKNAIRGLTTAASVWAVAGIGLAAGAGLFGAAIATTAILLTILVAFKPLERLCFKRKRVWRLTIHAQSQPGLVAAIEASLRECHVEVWSMTITPDAQSTRTTLRLDLQGSDAHALAALADDLQRIPGVHDLAYHQHAAASTGPEPQAA